MSTSDPLTSSATGRVARTVARPGPLRSEQGDFHHSAPPLKQSHGAQGPLFWAAFESEHSSRLTNASWSPLCERQVTEAPSPIAEADSPPEGHALIRVRSKNAGMSASGFRVALRSLHYPQEFR